MPPSYSIMHMLLRSVGSSPKAGENMSKPISVSRGVKISVTMYKMVLLG